MTPMPFQDGVREPKHGWQGLEGASRSWVGNVRARCSDGSIIVDFPHTTIVRDASYAPAVPPPIPTLAATLTHCWSSVSHLFLILR